MWFLLGVLILVGFVVFIYFFIKNKLKNMFGQDISSIIKQARIEDEMIPKSLSSMDSIYMPLLQEDFKDLNINEIKRMAEKNILDILHALETKDTSNLKGKMKKIAEIKIEDSKKKIYTFDNIKIHNTVLSKYQRNQSIATITISSSFEYISNDKKVQDRAKVEFIYIIDELQLKPNQNVIGLNCPNCGAPIKMLGNKYCSYCQTGIKDIVKKSWICNDVTFY